MYIQPDGKVKLLKGVPLDPTFEHSIMFQTESAQYTYFAGQAKYTFNDLTYTRYERGVIRVNLRADKLYDCNYMMFQNTAFGSKWFYAFIINVTYVSNDVASVTFMIDPIQTWHFEYEMSMCFIERCHTVTDGYAENLVDEGVEIGDVLSGKYTFGSGWNWYNINVVSAFNANNVIESDDFAAEDGGFYAGIYSGLSIASFDAQRPQTVNNLNKYLGKIIDNNRSSSVIAIFMCPQWMVTKKEVSETQSLPTTREVILTKPYGGAFSYANRDGSYSPKNNKLYNYPYCSLMVTNGDGDSKLYKWENFKGDGNTIAFSETAIFAPSPSAVTAPVDYGFNEGYRDTYEANPSDVAAYRVRQNFEEALYMNDFPTCSFSIDSYRAWLAQKKTTLPYEIGGFLLGQASGVSKAIDAGASYSSNLSMADIMASEASNATGTTALSASAASLGYRTAARASRGALGGQVLSLVTNTAGFVLDQMKQNAVAKLLPEGSNGTLSGNGASTSLRQKRFTYTNRSIKGEYAQMIDAYFTMFGYKVNAIAKPNRNARPHFTYLKTVNCQIKPTNKGGMPQDDAITICNIYNSGITFWNNPSEVGNYNLDNSPR